MPSICLDLLYPPSVPPQLRTRTPQPPVTLRELTCKQVKALASVSQLGSLGVSQKCSKSRSNWCNPPTPGLVHQASPCKKPSAALTHTHLNTCPDQSVLCTLNPEETGSRRTNSQQERGGGEGESLGDDLQPRGRHWSELSPPYKQPSSLVPCVLLQNNNLHSESLTLCSVPGTPVHLS